MKRGNPFQVRNTMINFTEDKRGVSLLIVLVILSTLIATAVGIATVFKTEITLSGISDDSISAIMAADAGMEKKLYDVRKLGGAVTTVYSATFSNNASYQTCPTAGSCSVGATNRIVSQGTFHQTQRSLEVTY